MDSVSSLAPSATNRYQGVGRSDDSAPRERPAAANAPQPAASTTVTLSRRAQELAARDSEDDTRAAAEAQQAASAADAAQEARRLQQAQSDEQATQQADASSPRAQAEAQMRRAYADNEGSVAR